MTSHTRSTAAFRARPWVGLVGLALAAGILAGCSAATPGTAPAATATAVRDDATGPPPETPLPDTALPEVEWPTTEETEALAAEELDRSWSRITDTYPDTARPDVDRVRFVTLDEWPHARADCMTAQGFTTVVDGGGASGTVNAGEEFEHDLAGYVCDAEYPVHPRFNIPLNDSQLQYLYAYFTGPLTQCLSDNGVEVDAAPEFAEFARDYYSASSWSPYVDVDPNGPVSALLAECAEVPDGIFG